MAESVRLEQLRRRVQQDPASIAFAQLAEEYRRAGRFQDAVDVCRAGLGIHPGYLSARVTLGRALIELNRLDEAHRELELVLKSAQENFAAARGMAEIHHRRGELTEALARYRVALSLAPNDPDLVQTVHDLTGKLADAAARDAGVRTVEASIAAATQAAPTEARLPDTAVREAAAPASSRGRLRLQRTITALEQWLDAIHAVRAARHA